MNPFPEANFANVQRHAYGRPTQRVSLVPRQQQETGHNANLPRIPSQTSAFTAYVAPRPRVTDPNSRPMQQVPYLPMPVPFYPNGCNNVGYGSVGHNMQQPSSNSISAHIGPLLQIPPVMTEVTGCCPGCTKTYDQIAVETLTNCVAWYDCPEETIRDRNIQSRAFVDGFGAALICFKNAGLSPGLWDPTIQH